MTVSTSCICCSCDAEHIKQSSRYVAAIRGSRPFRIWLMTLLKCQPAEVRPKGILRNLYSPGAKGLKWRFFDHESEQAEFGLKL